MGVIGGRAFVDMLKWNTAITELELAGNEIPDDVYRAIDAAITRNRAANMQSLHQKVRDTHLNATLQALTKQHHDSLASIQTKLVSSDSQVVHFSKQLHKASDEIARSQDGYRLLEAKLERALKEKELLEDLLIRDRKDHGEKHRELETEADRERDRRTSAEETHRSIVSELTKKSLEFESQSRDADIKLELLRRDKKTLLQEVEESRERETKISKSWESKIKLCLQLMTRL